VESPLPVLITVLDTANEPRPAAAKRVMQYKRVTTPDELTARLKKEMPDATDAEREAEHARRMETQAFLGTRIEQWDLDDIDADLQWCGLSGSPTKVHRVQWIVLTKEGYTEVAPTEEGVRSMVRELIVDHTLG
jgi:electron transfer flavoprotein beta subunit